MECIKNLKGEILRNVYTKEDIIKAIKNGEALDHCYMDISATFESDCKFLGRTSYIAMDATVVVKRIVYSNDDCIISLLVDRFYLYCNKLEILQGSDIIVISIEEVE